MATSKDRCVARVVLGVDDEHPVPVAQHDVALHDGEHGPEAVVERPLDLRGRRPGKAALRLVVLEDELLEEPAHALVVHEPREPALALVGGDEHAVEDELADAQ